MQKILDLRFSPTLHSQELELRKEIEEVLTRKELLWFQQSRSDWLQNGDRNTSYFHSPTLERRNRNMIEGLIMDND